MNPAAGKSTNAQEVVRETDPDGPLGHYARSKWLGAR